MTKSEQAKWYRLYEEAYEDYKKEMLSVGDFTEQELKAMFEKEVEND